MTRATWSEQDRLAFLARRDGAEAAAEVTLATVRELRGPALQANEAAVRLGQARELLAAREAELARLSLPHSVLVARQGLANTVAASPAHRPGDRLLWLEPVEDVARREKLWERIISGDSAARVLAP